MRRLPRFIAAIVLIALYALIVISPLAPLALHSPLIAHAVTGECAADCSICGCSPERSASHTCCCWQKKQLHEHDDHQEEPECCRKKHASQQTAVTISSRPCGSSKILAFSGVGQGELLLSLYSQVNPLIFVAALYTPVAACRTDWRDDPPKPPPRVSCIG